MSVVTNECGHEAGEDMGERSRFLVYLEYIEAGPCYRGDENCFSKWTGTVSGLFNAPW